jgi:hypothetical protein
VVEPCVHRKSPRSVRDFDGHPRLAVPLVAHLFEPRDDGTVVVLIFVVDVVARDFRDELEEFSPFARRFFEVFY